MKWKLFGLAPWLDTRARFVAALPRGGRLLDLGTSDGETLGHFQELRPDLKLHAVDLQGKPEGYPQGCEFQRANLETERLRWADGSFDGITCMHLVEHLRELAHLFGECGRLLKPGGRLYVETPHPKTMGYSSPQGVGAGTFTMNFFDDLTHVRIVTVGGMAQLARSAGLKVHQTGISRNWLFAAAWPIMALAAPSRARYTAQAHFRGWSSYIVLEKAR